MMANGQMKLTYQTGCSYARGHSVHCPNYGLHRHIRFIWEPLCYQKKKRKFNLTQFYICALIKKIPYRSDLIKLLLLHLLYIFTHEKNTYFVFKFLFFLFENVLGLNMVTLNI